MQFYSVVKIKTTDFKYNNPLTICFECSNDKSGKQDIVKTGSSTGTNQHLHLTSFLQISKVMFMSFFLIFFRFFLLANEGTLHQRKTLIIVITVPSTFLGRLWPGLQYRTFAKDAIFLEPRSIYWKNQESLENYSLSLLVIFASIFYIGFDSLMLTPQAPVSGEVKSHMDQASKIRRQSTGME